jgi:hypothetical protein
VGDETAIQAWIELGPSCELRSLHGNFRSTGHIG